MTEDRQERLRAKVRRIEAILDGFYGERTWDRAHYSEDLVGGLVATILSQNTSDLNSGRAFASLKASYPGGWEDVRTDSVSRVADAIRCGGLANTKAPRIQAVLQDISERVGKTNLDHLTEWDTERVKAYLRSFPGVGAKTAACLLMFHMGRPVLAVDTHVHRVAGRLGLIGPRTDADRAHDELQALLDDDRVYSFHVHLIEHGRRCCHARKPECPRCPLTAECDAYQAQVWAGQGAAA